MKETVDGQFPLIKMWFICKEWIKYLYILWPNQTEFDHFSTSYSEFTSQLQSNRFVRHDIPQQTCLYRLISSRVFRRYWCTPGAAKFINTPDSKYKEWIFITFQQNVCVLVVLVNSAYNIFPLHQLHLYWPLCCAQEHRCSTSVFCIKGSNTEWGDVFSL